MAEPELNLENIQEDIQPSVFENLDKLQAMGVGQDKTPYYKTQIDPALINLPPDYSTFFTAGSSQYEKMLKGLEPIGYEGGFKPVRIDKNLSMEDKLSQIYYIQKGNNKNITPERNREASENNRDKTGKVFTWKDGKVYELDIGEEQKELNFFENKFGNFLPVVTGPADIERRALYEKQLEELNLTPDDAKNLQKKLKESFFYADKKTGKIRKHEEAKDLSYLIPTEGDASFKQQFNQIMGRTFMDFPSVFSNLALSGIKQSTKMYNAPDKNLVEEYTYTTDGRKRIKTLKSDEQYVEDLNTYVEQEQNQLQVLQKLTEKFDEMQNTNSVFMSHKQFYKNIVYNNTGFMLDGKLLDELAVQNPDESIIFHVADTAMESLPYVAVLSGVFGAFGIKGTQLADDALKFSLKNSGPGLKYASPIHAVNAYLQQEKIKSIVGKQSPNKFIKKMQTRFEKNLLTKSGVQKLKTDLTDEISSIDEKILKAVKLGDNKRVQLLTTGKESLIAKQAGLEVKYFTTAEKSLFRNEVFASTFGGVGDYFFGVNSGPAIVLEFGGAIFEPSISKKFGGFKGMASSVVFHTGNLLDTINTFKLVGPNSELVKDITNMSKAQYLNLNLRQVKVIGKDGIDRNITKDEAKGLKGFTDMLIKLSPQRRAEVLGRMTALDDSLNIIKKNLSGAEKEEVNLLFGQVTGLASLQALDEIYAVKIKAGNMTTDMLRAGNDYIASQSILLKSMDETLQKLLGRENQTPEFTDFINKVETVVTESQTTIKNREEELLVVMDSIENYMRTGNLFDNTDIYQQNIEQFVDDLSELSVTGTTDAIKQRSIQFIEDLDDKIIQTFDDIGKGLNADASNYKVNYFSGLMDGFYTHYKIRAKQNYIKLYRDHPNVKVDVTEFFESLIDPIVPRNKRFSKFQDPVSLFTRSLPASYETNGLIRVIEDSTQRNVLEHIGKTENHSNILEMFEEIPDEINSILNIGQNLSEQNQLKVFNALRKNIKETFPSYKNVNLQSINSIDIRDALGGDIPLNMNLEEIMEFKSGLSFMTKASAGDKVGTFYAGLSKQADDSIRDSINALDNEVLIDDYITAVNTYADFKTRYTAFAKLNDWTKFNGTGSYLQKVESKDGSTKNVIERVDSINKEATEIANQYDKNLIVPNYKHQLKSNEWIDWSKLLSDESEATKFINEIVLPSAGTRDLDKIGLIADPLSLEGGEYFLDFNNKETVKKLSLLSRYLTEEVGAYLRRTDAGALAQDANELKRAIAKDTPGDLKGKKIKLFTALKRKFTVGTGDNKILLLDIDSIIDTNFGIETLIARNTTVNAIAKSDQVEFAFQFKKVKGRVKQIQDNFNKNLNLYSDDSVIMQFGESLTKPSNFVNRIILGDGKGKQNYDRLYSSLVSSGKMSEKEFNSVAKSLVAEDFFKRFASAKEITNTVIQGKVITTVDNVYVFNTGKAREFLTRNEDMLRTVLGNSHYDDTIKILDIPELSAGANTSKIDAMRMGSSMSPESLMSRLYAINRGVISVKYVAGEIAMRRYVKNKGVLIKDILENPKMASVVRKILENNDPYADAALNESFAKLLNETTTFALSTREILEKGEYEAEQYQNEFLTNLNSTLSGL